MSYKFNIFTGKFDNVNDGGGSAFLSSNVFTTADTWNAVTGLTGVQPINLAIRTKEMTSGQFQLIVDGTVEYISLNTDISRIVTPSSSLVIKTIDSPPFDISVAISVGVALSVSAQETDPVAMIFNNNGTRLYVMGHSTNSINEYTLTTPYDISTATFTRMALSVSVQEGAPMSMIFNNDGTRLYIMGVQGKDINEYTLTTPYDISTATFTRIVLSVLAQEANPRSMMFNNNGTRLYIMGSWGGNINEYTLTTPFDISTAVFTRMALNTRFQGLNPVSFVFNNNGTRLYVMGQSTNNINEYTLTTPYDISTATFTRVALSVLAQVVMSRSMIFNNNGTRLYVLDGWSNIHEYTIDIYSGTAFAIIGKT